MIKYTKEGDSMQFEIEIIKWLQQFRTSFLDFLFEFITYFGEEMIVIALLGFIYWVINKDIGKRLAMTVFVSIGINSMLKVLIARPRPFQVDDSISNLRPETSSSYAMPSGHTQTAGTTFFGLAYFFKKKYLIISAILITLLVGFSRLYIGVHYLSDVVVGAILSLIIVYVFNYFLTKTLHPSKVYRSVGYIAFLAYIMFIIIYGIKSNSDQFFDGNLFYYNLETISKMIGALIGFIIGIEIEEKYVNFSHHKNLTHNIIRFILGLAIVMIIRVFLSFIFSMIIDTSDLTDLSILSVLAVLLDFIRYALMVIVAIGLYPLLFKKFNF